MRAGKATKLPALFFEPVPC